MPKARGRRDRADRHSARLGGGHPAAPLGRKTVPTRGARLKALARAFRYQRFLDEGRYASINEMAKAEKIERGYLGTLLRLTLLAPAIVEAILDGRHSDGVRLPRLMEPFPTCWSEQRQALLSTAAAC
jgi:hypothetical protein